MLHVELEVFSNPSILVCCGMLFDVLKWIRQQNQKLKLDQVQFLDAAD